MARLWGQKIINYLSVLIIFQIIACTSKTTSTLLPVNDLFHDNESVKIDFDIIPREIEGIINMGYESYNNYSILSTIKQYNISDTLLELFEPQFIVYENFEIKNINGENRDSLIASYDYDIIFDPVEPYFNKVKLEPMSFTLDTIDIQPHFYFFLSSMDTLLIRVKKRYFKEYVYSNWDTLILK